MNLIQKFSFLMLEISGLFLLINFIVAIIQHYLPTEKIQQILGAKQKRGYIFAALLGGITPFCTCSTIPVLKGLLKAGAGFGSTMVFLFSSPLLNPVIVVLFMALLGMPVTLIYVGVALVFSIGAGILLEKLGFERYIIDSSNSNNCCCPQDNTSEPTIKNTMIESWNDSWKNYLSILPHLLISIGIGTLIYGYVPDDYLSQYIGNQNPFAIPIASVIGIPLYVRASVLLPLSSVLVSKGVSLGAVVALIIGGAGASLPEVILLKSLFKIPLVIAFLIVVLSMAITAGYIIQGLF